MKTQVDRSDLKGFELVCECAHWIKALKTLQATRYLSHDRETKRTTGKNTCVKKKNLMSIWMEIRGFKTHLLRIPDVSEKPTFHGSISSSSVFSAMLGSCFGRRSPGSSRFWPVKSTKQTLFLLLFRQHNQRYHAVSPSSTVFAKLSSYRTMYTELSLHVL